MTEDIFFIYGEKYIKSTKIYKYLSKNYTKDNILLKKEDNILLKKEDNILLKKEDNILLKKEDNVLFIEPQLSFYLNFIKEIDNIATPTISLDQIIQSNARSIIFTTYMIEMEWLIRSFPILQNIPVIIVHSHPNLQTGKLPTTLASNVSFKRAYLPIFHGICHGKIIIVKYDNFLRVVVSTANLLKIDYERKTQGLWVQDFPKINEDNKTTTSELALDFKYTLHDYLTRLDLNADFLNNYSFNNVKIVLITSVPGYHSKENLNNYGHLKVKKFLEKCDQHPKFKNSPLLAQISSIGSLSESWLKEIQNSFCYGDNKNVDIKIVWPTSNFVKNSIDGYAAGSSLCFPKVNLKPFLKPLFYEYNSSFERKNIPPHIKTYTREVNGNLPWFILTSSNLSMAAWGQLQKNETQLFIRHYEIGVLFLPEENKHYPLPYNLPLEKNEDPWVWR